MIVVVVERERKEEEGECEKEVKFILLCGRLVMRLITSLVLDPKLFEQ
jgi:hypothetical protein